MVQHPISLPFFYLGAYSEVSRQAIRISFTNAMDASFLIPYSSRPLLLLLTRVLVEINIPE